MAGEFTDAEQKIYDEFEAGGRAVLEKAKADAAAIGVDLKKIVGPFEAEVAKDAKAVSAKVMKWWEYLLHFLDFLDDPRGKFSYKRGSGVAALVTSIIFASQGKWELAALYFGGAVVIAIFCAITKT
jgi:hypothetical protein